MPKKYLVSPVSSPDIPIILYTDIAADAVTTPKQAAMVDIFTWGSINEGTPKWMVYKGKSYSNGWFRGTSIYGNLHIELANGGCKLIGNRWTSE